MMNFFRTRTKGDENWKIFLENDSKLSEALIASSNGKYSTPFRTFSAAELIKATNNYSLPFLYDASGELFRGSFHERPILVKRYRNSLILSYIIEDIVLSSQMSSLKHVLKLLGCCLECEFPALVYEDAGIHVLLPAALYDRPEINPMCDDPSLSLSWEKRLKIATDIGSAIAYLHSAFQTPVIHRDLSVRNIAIDKYGNAKLLDFSLCKRLPPGKLQVEDCVVGRTGYVEPEYMQTGIVTEKCDVYMFGVLLLILVTGKRPFDFEREPFYFYITDLVKGHIDGNQLTQILDPLILREGAGIQQDCQLQAFLELALRCTQGKGEDRPDILDVAKELRRIQKSCH